MKTTLDKLRFCVTLLFSAKSSRKWYDHSRWIVLPAGGNTPADFRTRVFATREGGEFFIGVNMRVSHGGEVQRWCRKLNLNPEKTVDFSASVNPFGPPPGFDKVVQSALANIGRYPDSDSSALVEKIAAFENVPPECVLVGNGSTELIYLLPRLWENPPRALICAPTFSEYAAAVENVRGEVHFYKSFQHENDTARLNDLADRFDLMFLCNPNNPTGALYGEKMLSFVCDLARDSNTTVCIDESFMDFVLEKNRRSLVKVAVETPQLVIIKSLTKFWGVPGLRLGYAVSHPETIRNLRLFKEPWSVNSIAQEAGVFFLGQSDFIREMPLKIAEIRREVTATLKKNSKIKTREAAANFLFLEFQTLEEVERVWEESARQGVFFRLCSNFNLCPPALRLGLKDLSTTMRAVNVLAGL